MHGFLDFGRWCKRNWRCWLMLGEILFFDRSYFEIITTLINKTLNIIYSTTYPSFWSNHNYYETRTALNKPKRSISSYWNQKLKPKKCSSANMWHRTFGSLTRLCLKQSNFHLWVIQRLSWIKYHYQKLWLLQKHIMCRYLISIYV